MRGGGVKAERIKDAKAKAEDPTEQKEELATWSPVLELLQLLSVIIFDTLSLIHPPIPTLCARRCALRPPASGQRCSGAFCGSEARG